MWKAVKIVLTAAGAATLLALAVGSASATRLELKSPEKGWRLWGIIEFSSSAGGETFRCSLTLEGTWHRRTFQKVSGSLIGYVTKAKLAGGGTEPPCTGGTGAIPQETLPWHMRYLSFEGTLPAITGVRVAIVGFPMWVRSAFGSCLARSTAEHPIIANIAAEAEGEGVWRRSTTATFEGRELPIAGEFICFFATGALRGANISTSVLSEAEPILLRLI